MSDQDTWAPEGPGLTPPPGKARRARAGGLPERYEDLGRIAAGGMGEVRRVRDGRTGAILAMKLQLGTTDAALARRFQEEARLTAQLQHPAIVAVQDLGELPDGRLWFTMEEVHGQTLEALIGELHRVSGPAGWGRPASGWTLRRLVDAFARLCSAVGYAHERGVIHRDLKPSNLMVGEYGDVRVVDWGIARPTSGVDAPSADVPPVGLPARRGTRAGQVIGTPRWMSPEQARGEALDARSDVYSLGAVLWALLSGAPPPRPASRGRGSPRPDGRTPSPIRARAPVSSRSFSASEAPLSSTPGRPAAPSLPPPSPNANKVARSNAAEDRAVRSGSRTLSPAPSLPLDGSPLPAHLLPLPAAGPPLPAELVRIAGVALSADREARFGDAGALARRVGEWLDGTRREEDAEALVRQAQALEPEVARCRAQAEELQRAAAQAMVGVHPDDPVEKKRPAWSLQDAERNAVAAARDAEREVERLLRAARLAAPESPLPQDALADHYRARLVTAEARGDAAAALDLAALLAENDRGQHAAFLRGDGAVSVVTDPEGAPVELWRYEQQDRRLVPVFVRALGVTPLREVALPRGSWLLQLVTPDGRRVPYPIVLGRGEHWDGTPPGEGAPAVLRLPRAGELGVEDRLVLPGWFVAGGDPLAPDGLPGRRVWVDGLVARRHPVTVGDYHAFLIDVAGKGGDVAPLLPRDADGRVRWPGEPAAPGALVPQAPVDGRLPVAFLPATAAMAYARWEADRTGQAWRLPHDLEWEKAARGVDGRAYPWGDFLDPTWCRMVQSERGSVGVAPVDRHPEDEGVYGLRGAAGNLRDWCANAYRRGGLQAARLIAEAAADDEPLRMVRGGSWSSNPEHCRLAARYVWRSGEGHSGLGVRLVRGWE